MLDVDLGTYPYVTPRRPRRAAAAGSGIGRGGCTSARHRQGLRHALGAGPFPTELLDDTGEYLSRVGHEFGCHGRRLVAGSMRLRCAVPSCITVALAVRDQAGRAGRLGQDSGVRGLRNRRRLATTRCLRDYGACAAVYEEMPGWKESTVGITSYDDLR